MVAKVSGIYTVEPDYQFSTVEINIAHAISDPNVLKRCLKIKEGKRKKKKRKKNRFIR